MERQSQRPKRQGFVVKTPHAGNLPPTQTLSEFSQQLYFHDFSPEGKRDKFKGPIDLKECKEKECQVAEPQWSAWTEQQLCKPVLTPGGEVYGSRTSTRRCMEGSAVVNVDKW